MHPISIRPQANPACAPLARHPACVAERLAVSIVTAHAPAESCMQGTTLWLVLRGQAVARSIEGEFALGPGDWIALDGASAPRLRTGRTAMVLAVAHRSGGLQTLFPGRGHLARGSRAAALRLWRTPRAEPGVRAFVAELQADLAAGIARCPGHSEPRKRQVLMRMQRARLCLEGQAGSGLRIAELARRTHYSPWYFSKVFHAVYGIAPLQFAARMRLEHARRLLATTHLPVTEVSAACGFDNPCSFARAFRARFGMTASQHRQRHGAEGPPR